MHTWANTLPIFFCFLLTLRTYPQRTTGLAQVAQIDLQEHPDSLRLFSESDEDHGRRAPLFAIALTPDNDFLGLIGKHSGPWNVIRIKNWLGQKPTVEHLDVPGYGAVTSTGEFSIKPQMLIAQNGKYLVTVAPEPWPGGGDATINVIDLETFRLVLTQPASQEGLRGDWQLGPDGSIQVHGFTRDSAKPAGSKQWLAFLSLPSLRVEDRCDYTVAFNQPVQIQL